MDYELNNKTYNLKYRLINGDINLSKNSFQTSDFKPNGILLILSYYYYKIQLLKYLEYLYVGCVCVYSNSKSFEYIRDSLEKTLLSNLEKDDKLPFQGLPIILLYLNEYGTEPNLSLQEEGQSLADR